MAAMSSLRQRQGMIFLDDSSSGEFPDGDPLPEVIPAYRRPSAGGSSSRSSSRGDDSERECSYDEIYSSSDDEESYHSDCDDIAEYWDPYLYQLQLQAPKPNCIPCLKQGPTFDKPFFYGVEYHGSITREETSRLLGETDGNYLVRKGLSHSGSYSLSFVFDQQVRHYKLYFEDGYHYVGEKPFDTIEDLVQDGLITLYMENNNVEEYLQSARETRIGHYLSNVGTCDPSPRKEVPLPNREKEPNVGDLMSGELEEMTVQDSYQSSSLRSSSNRRPVYQPCTIPHKRDCTTIQPSVEGEGFNEEQKTSSCEERVNVVQQLRKRKHSIVHYQYEKPHNFKLHNYIGIMTWCDYCRNFMWGLRNQGFKCKDCGYNVHKQCKDETGLDCQPSHQLIKRVYGVELTTLVKMEGNKIPAVIKDCIEEVENRGLEVEGLYRMSGKKNDVLRLKAKFDTNMCADLSKFEDIHALTGAMKLYLRELPIPLMTFDVYDLCLIAVRMRSQEEGVEMLRIALQRLPPAHYNTLRHLIRHLHKVQQLKDKNKMDSKNLAVVFTPSLMRSPHTATGIMAVQKLPEEKKAVDLLIQHYNSLFCTGTV